MDFELARRNMVASQVLVNKVNDPLVIDAISQVPREKFLPVNRQNLAYLDQDLELSSGRWLMQPMVAARLIQLADLRTQDNVLVLPCGAGYMSVLISKMVESVVSIEEDKTIYTSVSKTISELAPDNVVVINSPLKEGCLSESPFDVIFFDGGVEKIPDNIQLQLADKGRLVAVFNDGKVGRATIIERYGDAFGKRVEFDVSIPTLPEFKVKNTFLF